jgi:hypothetical protein
MRRTPVIAVLAVAALIGGGAVTGAAVSGSDPSRQEVVAERGARVMPFSLGATTHVFDATVRGGTQRVIAKDPDDSREIELIRGHLRAEAEAFGRGDFADPVAIHGEDMPGLRALRAGHRKITVRYRDLPAGAEIAYGTESRKLASALRAWFNAQLGDHAGDAASADRSGVEHTDHSGHTK